VTLRASVLTTR